MCDNYPYITLGDVVERKRVAEVMSSIQAAQRDGYRSQAAAKRVALRVTAAAPIPAAGRARPCPTPPAAAPAVAPAPPSREDLLAEQGRHYVLRWVRRQAFLYERTPTGRRSQRTGSMTCTEVLLGPVDDKVAQQWQDRGNPLDPPPLAQARVPALARERTRPEGTAPARHPDGLSRLSAALWFADTFHAAEMQRMKEYNEAANELAAAASARPPRREDSDPPEPSRRLGPAGGLSRGNSRRQNTTSTHRT